MPGWGVISQPFTECLELVVEVFVREAINGVRSSSHHCQFCIRCKVVREAMSVDDGIQSRCPAGPKKHVFEISLISGERVNTTDEFPTFRKFPLDEPSDIPRHNSISKLTKENT